MPELSGIGYASITSDHDDQQSFLFCCHIMAVRAELGVDNVWGSGDKIKLLSFLQMSRGSILIVVMADVTFIDGKGNVMLKFVLCNICCSMVES